MNKRPITVTGIAFLFIAVGALGLARHIKEITSQEVFHAEDPWLLVVPLVIIISGIFLVLGRNWARWVGLAWMTVQVVFRFFDSLHAGTLHVVLLLLIGYCLLGPEAGAYFQRPGRMGS